MNITFQHFCKWLSEYLQKAWHTPTLYQAGTSTEHQPWWRSSVGAIGTQPFWASEQGGCICNITYSYSLFKPGIHKFLYGLVQCWNLVLKFKVIFFKLDKGKRFKKKKKSSIVLFSLHTFFPPWSFWGICFICPVHVFSTELKKSGTILVTNAFTF